MSKKTRKQRKEEERALLADFDAALAKERGESSKGANAQANTGTAGEGTDDQPKTLHCKRCKTLMQDGVCPTCGFTVYIPMAEEKRKKIKTVVTVVCLAAFFILFFALGLYK